ncbi:hypothetical protein L596_002979 [Steinernema carpocapsae]|uniref:Uncharacterized protein n=1 Tax=Steinernema carpocapsae TaxID=34508 RepID=A0A4U8UR47_STECR|nr:hypothetical protein L596_002979 [Steinernema carpocapsae]
MARVARMTASRPASLVAQLLPAVTSRHFFQRSHVGLRSLVPDRVGRFIAQIHSFSICTTAVQQSVASSGRLFH